MDVPEYEPPLAKYISYADSTKPTTSINWSKHLNLLLRKLELPGSGFSRDTFALLQRNSDRFRALLLDRSDVLPVIEDFMVSSIEKKKTVVVAKCALKSAKYRRLGNEAYSAKQFVDASYLYTLAILFGPQEVDATGGGSALALAHGNRSALFFEIGQWKDAIEDIDLALEAGHQAVSKLLLRKVDSLTSLGRVSEAKRLLDGPAMKNTECPQRQLLDGLEDDSSSDNSPPPGLLTVSAVAALLPEYEPSQRLSSLSRKLQLKNDPAKGRHLVAVGDIKPGDILAVDCPYASVLLKPYELGYCHHCCRRLDAPGVGSKEWSGVKKANAEKIKGQLLISGPLVPCINCTRVLFCSPHCRTASWNAYHQFECPILPVLYEIGIGHLALRLLLTAGLDAVRDVVLQGGDDDDQDRLDLQEPTTADSRSNYSNIYKLVHHSEKFPVDDLVQYTITAGLLAELAKKGTFPVGPEDQLEFTGGILLRHILQLVTNAHSIAHFIASPRGGTFFDVRIATALYPSISLMNHSCDPNVVSTFDQGRLNLLRASKTITAGEEVFNCYGVHFARGGRVKRQEQLKSQYFFDCRCSRCVMETEEGFEGRYYPVACKECGSLMSRSSSSTFTCIECSTEVPQLQIASRYATIDTTLNAATQLVDMIDYSLESGTFDPTELQVLEDSVAQLGQMLHVGSSLHLGKLLDALSRFCHISLKQQKAQQYLFQSVTIVEANYGPTSIELVCELIKLSDLLYLEVERGKKCNDEKKTIQQWRQVTEQGLKLLRYFALIDAPAPLGDDSCFFAVEYRRLVGRTEVMDKPMKTMLQRMLEMVE